MIELTNTLGFTAEKTNIVVYSKMSVLSTIAAACFRSEFNLPVRELNQYTGQDAVFLGCSNDQYFKALVLPDTLNMLLPESFNYTAFGWLVVRNKEWLEPLKRVELAYDTVETLCDETNRDYLFIAELYERALSYLQQANRHKFVIDYSTYYGTTDVRDRINYRRASSERESNQLYEAIKASSNKTQFVSLQDHSPFAIMRLVREKKLERTDSSLVFKIKSKPLSLTTKLKFFFSYFTTQQYAMLT